MGESESPSELPGASDLLAAYAALTPRQQRSLVELAQAMVNPRAVEQAGQRGMPSYRGPGDKV